MLAEGLRVQTRDGKVGVIVEERDGWWDVLLEKKKKPELYIADELTVIDDSLVTDLPKEMTLPIFSNQLVRLHDGRVGFTQKNRITNLWEVYMSDTHKVERHADWRLTPLQIGEPVEPKVKSCTAIVPASPVRTHKEATFKRCEPLTRPALYVPSDLSLFLLYLGAIKEIKRLRHTETAITPTVKPDIVIDKPIKQPDNVYIKAVTSQLFDAQQLKAIGDAQAILTAAQSKMETTS